MATVQQLTQRVIHAVGEVEGTAVQVYSEPRVREALTQMFYLLIRKYWWPEYMLWSQTSLDGTLGVVTTNIGNSFSKLEDIRAIIPSGETRAVPLLPQNMNPFDITGQKVRYFESLNQTHQQFAHRRLQFWPKAATGSLAIHGRVVPPTIGENTEIYLNENLMVFSATWLILEQEDINPNAAGLMERMFNEQFTDILKSYGEQPIEVSSASRGNFLTEWLAN